MAWYDVGVSEQVSSRAGQEDVRLRIPELAGKARLRRLLLLAGLVALVGAGLAYYFRPRPPEEVFRTFPAQRRTLVQLVDAAGSLDARNRVEVPAPLTGKLLAVHAVEGQSVKAGDLLAELDARATTLAVRGAQASAAAAAGRVSQARAQLKEAERNLERARGLLAKDLASQEDVANAEFERARAQAALQAAEAEQRVAGQSVASAQLEQQLTRIEAPVTGVVLRAPDRLGAAVSPDGPPLFVIGDPLDTLRIDATVSEADVTRVKPGAEAEVEVAAVHGKTFRGRVQRVGIEAKRGEGAVLYPVVLTVDNPDGVLLPGMTARVRMQVARVEDVLTVHEAALRFMPQGAPPQSGNRRIWKRVGPDRLEPIEVRVVISDGVYAQVEVLEGSLQQGDLLAVGLLHPESGTAPRVKLGGR